MGIDVVPVPIHGTQAIRISIGSQTNSGLLLQYCRPKSTEILFHRFRKHATKEWVRMISDRPALNSEFSEDLPKKILGNPMHGIGHNARLGSLNDSEVNQRLNMVEILIPWTDNFNLLRAGG